MNWIIEKDHEGMLVREYLISVRAFSHRMLKTVKFDGAIKVNGENVTVRKVLYAGDKLEIVFPEEIKGQELFPRAIPLDIVYEDDDVIVLNKQPGIPVIPSRLHSTETIAHGLLYYYQQKGLTYTVHIVTRLDRDTSGLMLIAKHSFSHSMLSLSQQDGKVKRGYTAFVAGTLSERKGAIEAPIGRKPDSIIEREVREDGKRALTHYEVVDEYDGFSHVEIQLETGRTHQIRVHFSYLGHPLLGDDLYGESLRKINRQALHCHRLSFLHPFQNEWKYFEITLPKDMSEVISKCEN